MVEPGYQHGQKTAHLRNLGPDLGREGCFTGGFVQRCELLVAAALVIVEVEDRDAGPRFRRVEAVDCQWCDGLPEGIDDLQLRAARFTGQEVLHERPDVLHAVGLNSKKRGGMGPHPVVVEDAFAAGPDFRMHHDHGKVRRQHLQGDAGSHRGAAARRIRQK